MKYAIRIIFALFVIVMSAIGVLAEEETSNTIQYNHIGFTVDASLATNANILNVPADSEMTFPPEPQHTVFRLYNALPVPESLYDSFTVVTVYPIADMDGFEQYQAMAEDLSQLLAERPELSAYTESLAFMPIATHGQVLHTRTQYVETDNVKGISYVTAILAAAEPFLSDSFYYTFQGISTDGNYYISVVTHLTTTLYPAEAEPVELSFYDEFDQYLVEATDLLNNAPLDAFSPALPSVESLIASLHINQ